MFAASLENRGDTSVLDPFLEHLNKHIKARGADYVEAIQGLDKIWSAQGTRWLQGMIDSMNEEALTLIPSYSDK